MNILLFLRDITLSIKNVSHGTTISNAQGAFQYVWGSLQNFTFNIQIRTQHMPKQLINHLYLFPKHPRSHFHAQSQHKQQQIIKLILYERTGSSLQTEKYKYKWNVYLDQLSSRWWPTEIRNSLLIMLYGVNMTHQKNPLPSVFHFPAIPSSRFNGWCLLTLLATWPREGGNYRTLTWSSPCITATVQNWVYLLTCILINFLTFPDWWFKPNLCNLGIMPHGLNIVNSRLIKIAQSKCVNPNMVNLHNLSWIN